MAVRLFIGNLPYGASEADLRAHFAAVAEPSHVAMPVDRETGRPRGFAFVEFAERAVAEEVIRKFDSQPFQGRPLAVSEARAREDRPPGPPRSGGFAPRPGGGGGFGGPRQVVVADSADHVPRGAAGSAVHGPVLVAHQLDPEDGTGAPTSAHLHLPSGCEERRPRNRNTSPAAPSKRKAEGASTLSTISRTTPMSRSTTSLPKRMRRSTIIERWMRVSTVSTIRMMNNPI